VAPSAVGPVKAMLLDLDATKAAAVVEPMLKGPCGGGQSVRDRLKEFASASGLQL